MGTKPPSVILKGSFVDTSLSYKRIETVAKNMRAKLVQTIRCDPAFLHNIDIEDPFRVEALEHDPANYQIVITIRVRNDDWKDLVRRVQRFLCIYLVEPGNEGYNVVTEYVLKEN
jgi:hypothetical protein